MTQLRDLFHQLFEPSLIHYCRVRIPLLVITLPGVLWYLTGRLVLRRGTLWTMAAASLAWAEGWISLLAAAILTFIPLVLGTRVLIHASEIWREHRHDYFDPIAYTYLYQLLVNFPRHARLRALLREAFRYQQHLRNDRYVAVIDELNHLLRNADDAQLEFYDFCFLVPPQTAVLIELNLPLAQPPHSIRRSPPTRRRVDGSRPVFHPVPAWSRSLAKEG